MLLQQTVKYVLKSSSKIQRGKMFDDSILLFLKDVNFLYHAVNYLTRKARTPTFWWLEDLIRHSKKENKWYGKWNYGFYVQDERIEPSWYGYLELRPTLLWKETRFCFRYLI